MGLRLRICVTVVLSLGSIVRVQRAAAQSVARPDFPEPAPASRPSQLPASRPSQLEVAPIQARASASDAAGLIRLDVVVHDEKGNPVSGLPASDFALFENEKPDKVLSFREFYGAAKIAEPSVEAILFLDTTSLNSQQVVILQHEVNKFLRQNGGHLTHPVSIYWLTTSGLWVPPQPQPSVDGGGLAAAMEHTGKLKAIWKPGGFDPTPLDFLPLEAFGFIAVAERQKPDRKLLVWVGPDSTMPIKVDEKLFGTIVWFSTLLREARIALYSLSVAATEERAIDYSQAPDTYESRVKGVSEARRAMLIDVDRKVLALQSGGRVLEPSIDLATQIDGCVADASAWYVLRFDPQPADRPDEYHELKVVIGKTGLTATANTGFYDQPYYEDRPTVASKHLSVDELAAWLATAHGGSDAEMARQLSDIELTERLSSAKLISLEAGLRGSKARQALIAVADTSAFLDPPAKEISSEAPPDAATQREMQAKTVEYLTKMIPRLPNFFATRSTVFYSETAPEYKQVGEPGVGYQPLHVTEVSKARVFLRDGKEVAESAKRESAAHSQNNLTTYGTFGPILGTVILDAAPSGGLTWSHWDRSAEGRRAAFHFSVPPEKSHYSVTVCCLPDGDGTIPFHKLVGYHGEIAIDPATGSIFRLAIVADLKTAVPLTRSDMMVEYGPVKLGQSLYILPVRSVSIMRRRTIRLQMLETWAEGFRSYGPFGTNLNNAAFGEYHAFTSSSRMLPGYGPSPE